MKSIDEINKFNDDGTLTDELLEYFDSIDDDEAVVVINELMGSNDKLVGEALMTALFEQTDENMIYYEIVDLFRDESGKNYRRRMSLQSNPPTLIIKNSLGSQVEIVLTRGVAQSLLKDLKEVDDAYSGYLRTSKKKTWSELWITLKTFAKENTILFSLLAIFGIMLFISVVIL